jgi:hypothetical protein
MHKGIYFSANDKVYNWTLAFLRSFREHNPELPLYLIPFDSDFEAIKGLSKKFDFGIYEDHTSFDALEELGAAYELGHSEYGKYWFRRYAAFWGPLDVFMYLDCRQLILGDLNLVLNALVNDQLDFMYYDLALDQVYEPGELRLSFLLQKGGRGFNSGRWAARKNIFSKDELLTLGYESLNYRDQLNPRNTDQAFINYCIDKKPDLKTVHFTEYLGNYIQQGWAGQSGKLYKDGQFFYWWDYGGLEHKKKVLLLHWAGFGWTDALPQEKWLNTFSKPTFSTRIRRKISLAKKKIKGNYTFRKLLGHV